MSLTLQVFACLAAGAAVAISLSAAGPAVAAKVRAARERATAALPEPERRKRMLAMAAPGAIGLALWMLTGAGLFALVLAPLGVVVPRVLKRRASARRLTDGENQLPDALAMLASALRAGLSFPQAAGVLVKEMAPPLSDEFRIFLQDQRLGMSQDDAIDRLAARLPLEDVRMLATVLSVTRQAGGNVAERMDGLAATIRERARLRGQIRSLTAQGKLSGIVIGSLPAFLLAALSIIDPQLVQPLFTTAGGVAILVLAATLLAMGAFFIRRVVAIQV